VIIIPNHNYYTEKLSRNITTKLTLRLKLTSCPYLFTLKFYFKTWPQTSFLNISLKEIPKI